MAVHLFIIRDSPKTTAKKLDITPQILTRWRRERLSTQKANTNGQVGVSQEQQEILRLKKELKQAELERDILKKAVSMRCPASSQGATVRRTVGHFSIHESAST